MLSYYPGSVTQGVTAIVFLGSSEFALPYGALLLTFAKVVLPPLMQGSPALVSTWCGGGCWCLVNPGNHSRAYPLFSRVNYYVKGASFILLWQILAQKKPTIFHFLPKWGFRTKLGGLIFPI